MTVLVAQENDLLDPRIVGVHARDVTTLRAGAVEVVSFTTEHDLHTPRARSTRRTEDLEPQVDSSAWLPGAAAVPASLVWAEDKLALELRHAAPRAVWLARLQRESSALLPNDTGSADLLGGRLPAGAVRFTLVRGVEEEIRPTTTGSPQLPAPQSLLGTDGHRAQRWIRHAAPHGRPGVAICARPRSYYVT